MAEWLHKKLERYKIPQNIETKDGAITGKGRTIGRIFRDRDDLAVAEDLTEVVQRALNSSEFLIVLCSPASAQSEWVNKEVLEFKRSRGEGNVIPFIIEGEPYASDTEAPDEECFPPAVRFKLGDDGNLSTIAREPAAADARKDKDGKQRALLKTLAGILGVELDQLVERDLRVRHRRVMSITAGAIVAMIAMGALTLEAFQAREAAEAAREAADRSRADAEDLVEFMLTDLREKLEPVGRLDVLDAVGEKVLSYHENATRFEDASDDDIGRRARAYHLLAEMQYRRGNMDEAQTMFEQAAEATGELLKRDPNNTQRIFEHAQSVFWVGNQDFERGNFAETEIAFRKYKEMSDQLYAMEPDNVDWLIEVAYGNHNMGDILLRGLNLPRKAVPYIEKAALTFQKAFNKRPDSLFLKNYVAIEYTALTKAFRSIGHVRKVEEYLKLERETISELELLDSQNTNVRARLMYWFSKNAAHEMALGKPDAAIVSHKQALGISEQLLELEPTRAFWQDDKVLIELYLIRSYLEAKQFKEAQILFKKYEISSKILSDEEGARDRHDLDIRFLIDLTKLRLVQEGVLDGDERDLLEKAMLATQDNLDHLVKTQRGRRIIANVYEAHIKLLVSEGQNDEAARAYDTLWIHVDGGNMEQIPTLLQTLLNISKILGDEARGRVITTALNGRGYM